MSDSPTPAWAGSRVRVVLVALVLSTVGLVEIALRHAVRALRAILVAVPRIIAQVRS